MTTQPAVSPDTKGRKTVPLFLYIALFFLLVCINTLVAKFVVFSFGIAPGASSLYVVVALMIVFTLWFGMYGAAASYAGCYIGAGLLSGLPPDVSLYWSLADLWQVLIPLIAFRAFACDPALKTRRDMGVLVVFGIILNNAAGAVWGSVTLALGGTILWSEVGPVLNGWLAGNLVVCIVFIPAILHFFTPIIQDHELYIRRYWH
ncbi:MAG: hypothetical protein OS112_04105 [Methanoregula sp.]|nr:MAG: hypothetical protein OS112_04105 [Methanoregula sp.]